MIQIGGLNKNSFIDFPGKIACVIFTKGCNFGCPYCHNPDLADPGRSTGFCLDQVDFFNFLKRRKGLLDGVVISGGEPTLRNNLVSFIREIKGLGYAVKLDTNGSRPQVLRLLINEGLIDYIAMDIKTVPDDYVPLIVTNFDAERIKMSASVILASGLPHEFRTTCVAPLIDGEKIEKIARMVGGADLYVLQRVRHENVLAPEFFESSDRNISDKDLDHFKGVLEKHVKRCFVR